MEVRAGGAGLADDPPSEPMTIAPSAFTTPYAWATPGTGGDPRDVGRGDGRHDVAAVGPSAARVLPRALSAVTVRSGSGG